jgi:integrase/recombinase XerD
MNQRIDAFLAYLQGERSLSPNTVSAYRNDLVQFAEYLDAEAARQGSAGFALATIDRERLGGYFLHLRERGYSPASVARKVAAVRSFFHYLRRSGELAVDPTLGLGAPNVKKTLPRTISASDVRALLDFTFARDTPEGQRDATMLRLLYATGMRVSELVMLNTTDVDFEAGRVRVVGRGGRERQVPLDPGTAEILRRYVDSARPFLARNAPGQTALVLNQRGQRLTRQGFWLIMKALVKDAGLPVVVTPHTLRHSFATHQLRGGLAVEELRQLLGHASIATTQIYTQVGASPEAGAPDGDANGAADGDGNGAADGRRRREAARGASATPATTSPSAHPAATGASANATRRAAPSANGTRIARSGSTGNTGGNGTSASPSRSRSAARADHTSAASATPATGHLLVARATAS